MNMLEQVGRYTCMILMIFNISPKGFGFPSVGNFFVYGLGNALLLLAYWVVWGCFL